MWLFIGIFIVIFTLFYYAIEWSCNPDDFPQGGRVSSVLTAAYLTVASVFGGAAMHTPKTFGGHILCLALGLFLVLILVCRAGFACVELRACGNQKIGACSLTNLVTTSMLANHILDATTQYVCHD